MNSNWTHIVLMCIAESFASCLRSPDVKEAMIEFEVVSVADLFRLGFDQGPPDGDFAMRVNDSFSTGSGTTAVQDDNGEMVGQIDFICVSESWPEFRLFDSDEEPYEGHLYHWERGSEYFLMFYDGAEFRIASCPNSDDHFDEAMELALSIVKLMDKQYPNG